MRSSPVHNQTLVLFLFTSRSRSSSFTQVLRLTPALAPPFSPFLVLCSHDITVRPQSVWSVLPSPHASSSHVAEAGLARTPSLSAYCVHSYISLQLTSPSSCPPHLSFTLLFSPSRQHAASLIRNQRCAAICLRSRRDYYRVMRLNRGEEQRLMFMWLSIQH